MSQEANPDMPEFPDAVRDRDAGGGNGLNSQDGGALTYRIDENVTAAVREYRFATPDNSMMALVRSALESGMGTLVSADEDLVPVLHTQDALVVLAGTELELRNGKEFRAFMRSVGSDRAAVIMNGYITDRATGERHRALMTHAYDPSVGVSWLFCKRYAPAVHGMPASFDFELAMVSIGGSPGAPAAPN